MRNLAERLAFEKKGKFLEKVIIWKMFKKEKKKLKRKSDARIVSI